MSFLNSCYSKFSDFTERSKHPLLAILLIGLVVRIVLLPFTFNADMYNWVMILMVPDNGFGLYGTEGYWYTPIWGYVLVLTQYIGTMFGVTDYGSVVPEFIPFFRGPLSVKEFVTTLQFNAMMKIPLMIADCAVGLLLYRFVKGITGDRTKAILAFGLWFLCPFVIVESSVHGMFENIAAMFLICTLMLVHERSYLLAGFAYAFAILTKFFPMFFVFFLIAWVFRKEGWNRNGARNLGRAVIGTFAGIFLIYLPVLFTGHFLESLRFITGRLGVTEGRIMQIFTPAVSAAVILGIAAVIAVIVLLAKKKGPVWKKGFLSMEPKVRDRKVFFALLWTAIAVIAVIAAISVIAADRSSAVNMAKSVGSKLSTAMSVLSVFLEIYIAYRFAVSKKELKDCLITFMLLTSLAVFLWAPLPQYPILIVPILIVYIVSADDRYWKPFAVFALAYCIYDLILGGVSAVFGLASYTDVIGLPAIISIVDAIGSAGLGGMAFYDMLGAIGSIAAFLTLLYIPFVWLRRNDWGRTQ